METTAHVIATHKHRLIDERLVLQSQLEAVDKEIKKADELLHNLATEPDQTGNFSVCKPRSRSTIKELIQNALKENSTGLTTVELIRHVHEVYARPDILKTSVAPLLSNMKKTGLIMRSGNTWHL